MGPCTARGKGARYRVQNEGAHARRGRARNDWGMSAGGGGGLGGRNEKEKIQSGSALRAGGKAHGGTVDGSEGVSEWRGGRTARGGERAAGPYTKRGRQCAVGPRTKRGTGWGEGCPRDRGGEYAPFTPPPY